MKKTIKKLLFLLPLLVLFTGCSEDVYEEKMYEANFETKVNYVNINQVPFLIPSIQKFNSDYGYLSNASSPSNKETLNLNLDLDRILEYVYANGLKSYSIIIKKEFTEYEDKYLENLHIYKKEGEYESIIFRYNSINDTQEFDKSTFTGELTAYDLDGNMIGIGQIENGFSKMILIVEVGCFKIYYLSNAGQFCVKNHCEEEDGTGGGGGSSSGGSGSSGAGGSGSSGSSGSSGDTGGTGGVMGGGGVTVDILPNAPTTSYTNAQTAFLSSLSNFAEDNFFNLTSSTQNIVLGYVDNPNNQPYVNTVSSYINNNNNILTWMSEQSEQTQNQTFNYLAENNFSTGSQEFVGAAINTLGNGGDVDFPNNIFFDSSFKNSAKIKCVYNKIKNSSNNSFFNKMIQNFKNNTGKNLTFKVGTTSAGEWGITSGDPNNPNNFTITISSNLETKSNLAIMNTLCHELIHAYIFSTMADNGLISFDSNGEPILQINCNLGTNYNGINLNSLPIKERFEAILCAMNQNGTLTQQWSHDLFNELTFDINDYRENLEQFLTNEYDWNNETPIFISQASSVFGSNWINHISAAVSWIGLENTGGYTNHLNNYSNNSTQLNYIQDIQTYLSFAKQNCP